MTQYRNQRTAARDPHFRESTCEKCRITKVGINGATRYEVWQRSGQGWSQYRLNIDSFDEARAIASDDLGAAFTVET